MRDHDGKPPLGTTPGRRLTNRRVEYSRYAIPLATLVLLLAWIPVLLHRWFDPDEFEHSHAAWCVFKGMLPYKDFFEHHTPGYYYLLQPFFHGFGVSRSVGSAQYFLLSARSLSLVLTALSVFLLTRIGRLWEQRKAALLAGLLLVGQPMFLDKSIEIRPDVPALPLFLGCLWLLLRGLASTPGSKPGGLRFFFTGGLSLGAAILFTQKMLFVLPGAFVGLVIWSLASGRTKGGARTRLLLTLLFLVGVGLPIGMTWALFAFHHAGGEFIANNFLLNARWEHIPTHQLHRLIETSWPILALCLLGGAIHLSRLFRSGSRQYGGLLLISIMVGLFAELPFMPSAHSQYYLMPLPLVCLFAAPGLVFLVEHVQRRARPVLLVLVLIPLGVPPARALRDALESRNDAQIAMLGYVYANTMPSDVVMDGWAGTGVFRPHAFYYFFLHPETLAMLPGPKLDAYLDALERGEIRPRMIAMDDNLAALGPRFEDFVKANYVSSDGFFYFYLQSSVWLPPRDVLLRELRSQEKRR